MWVFNWFLYSVWKAGIVLVVWSVGGLYMQPVSLYQELVNSGATCMVYVPSLADPAFPQDPNSPPPCPFPEMGR